MATLKTKKKVQFSTRNLMYSPLPWSPELHADSAELPPSPMPSAATFPASQVVVGPDSTTTQPAPAAESSTPEDGTSPHVLTSAPSWAPPVIYSPWPAHSVSLPTPQDVSLSTLWTTPVVPAVPLTAPAPALYTHWPWPPPSPSPPPLYSAWQSVPTYSVAHAHSPAPLQLHILLAFAPFAPPNVVYDVSTPPSSLNPQLTPAFLEPATHPPLSALTLRSPRLADAWAIGVSPAHPAGFVCVLDVLRAVYTSLRLTVLRAEYDALPNLSERRRLVDGAYFARCRALTDKDARKVEELKGVKRVDFLGGKTRFLGLSGPVEGTRVWELNLSD